MRNVKLPLLVVIALAALTYFYSSDRTSRQADLEIKSLTLGAEKSLLTAAIWIAEDRGFFSDEGLDITIREFESGRQSFLSMLDGEVDVSTVAPTPIMFSSFKRDDFSIFATIVYSDDDVKVIARADKGIQTAADLAGKRVATPKGTTGQFFLNAFLVFNEISPSDITEVNIKPSQLVDALASGDVDAIVIWEPHGLNARKRLNKNAVQLPSSEVYRETFNLMVMKTIAKDRSETLERLLRALDRATSFIQQHKTDAQSIVAHRLDLDIKETAELWGDFTFELSLDKSLLVTMEDEARWAIMNKLTDKQEIPNYLNFISPAPLKTIKPKAVTLSY